MTLRPEIDDQSAVIAFLRDPKTHGQHAPIEVIETHCATVFLAGDRAYKIKRAVRYDYLDFSTLEKRRDTILRELELNLPAAPTLYRDVIAVTRDATGALHLGGAGIPVEYVLVMNRFDADAELAVMADKGRLDVAVADDLGSSIAAYHAATPPRPMPDGATLIAEILDELETVFSGMTDTLSAETVSAFAQGAERQLTATRAVLDRRGAAGFVRRCHGDLHLHNLVMIDDRPVPFDALEFDERLGTCDVAYDLAFLIMDLLHRGLSEQANRMFNAYLAASDDLEGLTALPLFLGVRAAIRAMVDVQTARLTGNDKLAREAQTYLDEASRFLAPPAPHLVVIGGISGTGKTTLSHRIAPHIGPAPGAVHLRSDLLRKAHFGVPPTARLPQAAYAPDITAQVYDTMHGRAQRALDAGHSVILDATYLSATARDGLTALTGPAARRFWLCAPAETAMARVTARGPDASDATADVVRAQLDRAALPDGWRAIDTSEGPEQSETALLSALGIVR